ncbi:MAG: hypothetical protein ABIC19_00645 [Patescibacteria group bacterium]|nr:hypothetical protein [Patescibacteria group bacterium]
MSKKKNPLLDEETKKSSKAPKKEAVKESKKVSEAPNVKEVEEPKKALTSDQEREIFEAKARKEIEAAEKIAYVVPLDPGEKTGAVQVVSLNGYTLTIKKGVRVNIPVPIAEVLDEKYKVETEAGAEMRDDNWDDKKAETLS